jgi:thiol-disulfide isomerase/thioredoxin
MLCGVVVACGGSHRASGPNNTLGKTVNISLPTDQGALVTVPLADARHTVVDFFAPTCEPCRKSLPELMAKRSELEARGAKLVLVAVLNDSESTEDARKALSSWGVSAPFLVDKGGANRRLGVEGLPATVIVDARGILLWSAPTGASAEDVVGAVP